MGFWEFALGAFFSLPKQLVTGTCIAGFDPKATTDSDLCLPSGRSLSRRRTRGA
jgi:hypothetical protein